MNVVVAFKRASMAGEEEDKSSSDHPYYPFRKLAHGNLRSEFKLSVSRPPHRRSPSGSYHSPPDWFHIPYSSLRFSVSVLQSTLESKAGFVSRVG